VSDAARRFDRRLLDDDKSGARQRQRTQVLEMPVIRSAVLGAVLAHRRHRNPVGEGDAAEAEWFEQETPSFHQIDYLCIDACRFDRASQWRTT
jgi:hypothetical protein